MKSNSIIFFLYALLFVCPIGAQNGNFHLEGTAPTRFNGKTVTLYRFSPHDINYVTDTDTALVINGKFEFTGVPYLDNMSMLSVGSYPDKDILSATVLLEAGNIQVILDTVSRVEGTALNDSYQQFNDSLTHFGKRYQSGENVIDECEAYTVDYVKKNLTNAVGRTVFMERRYRWQNISDFEMLYNLADDVLKNDKEVIAALKSARIRAEKMRLRTLLVNQSYTNYEVENLDGKKCHLADFVGKSELLLIDVWASWCGPCRAEVPHLKELYETYRDKGVEILGVSADTSVDSWEKAVRDLQMPWPQVRIGEELVNTFKKEYAIVGIPHLILLNAEGIIIASGPELRDAYLDQLLQVLMQTK